MHRQGNKGYREEYLSVTELAYMAGTSCRIVERLISLELIEPMDMEPEPCFRPKQAAEVRKLVRLHLQLGVSWSSMGLVVELLNRIEELENRLLRGV